MAPTARAEPMPAAQRRTVLASVRSVAFFAHSAAGIACGVDKECERLLRCCEGIARAAVARLETLGRCSRAPSPAVSCSKGVEVDMGEEVTAVDKKKKRQKRKPKKKRKKKAVGDAVAGAKESELADEWADTVCFGPQLQSQPLPLPLTSSPSRTLIRGDSDEARQPKLKQPRTSSVAASSSPSACMATSDAASTASGRPRPLIVGNLVKLFGLSRQELNGQVARLLSFDGDAERWAVQRQSGSDPIRVRLGNLMEVDCA